MSMIKWPIVINHPNQIVNQIRPTIGSINAIMLQNIRSHIKTLDREVNLVIYFLTECHIVRLKSIEIEDQ